MFSRPRAHPAYPASPRAEFIRRSGINFSRLIPSGRNNRAVLSRLVLPDRSELDAQVSTEDTLGPLSAHRRQRSEHHRPAEGGAQDVYLPRGHFHRRHGISESAGECGRLAV